MRFSKKQTPSQFSSWKLGSKYKLEKILGRGSYGSVAQAIQLETGKKVAVKKISNVFDNTVDCKRILREIIILSQLDHPCIVKLLEVVVPSSKVELETFDELYLVLEFCDSDLKKLMKSSLNLELNHIKTILWNLLHAMKYLHEARVIHRDLKPANILLNEDCTIKICDFGLARTVDDTICNKTQKLLEEIKPEDYSSEAKEERATASAQQRKSLLGTSINVQ